MARAKTHSRRDNACCMYDSKRASANEARLHGHRQSSDLDENEARSELIKSQLNPPVLYISIFTHARSIVEMRIRPSCPLLSLELSRLFLRSLLPLTQLSLDSNATKHTCNANPLHTSEAVSEPDDRDDHGKHFPGDSHSDQEKRAEDGQRVDC